MPARVKKIRHDENTRQKIQATRIIAELHRHVFGEREMTPTQVMAARVLLAKSMPDLQAVEHSGEITTIKVIRTPMIAPDNASWLQQHGDKSETLQ